MAKRVSCENNLAASFWMYQLTLNMTCTVVVVLVVALSSLARDWGEWSIIHPPPPHPLRFFFPKWRLTGVH